MKRFTALLGFLLSFMLPLASFGQTVAAEHALSVQDPGSYALPGSHFLQQENQRVLGYVSQHPEALLRPGLSKSAWTFVVGSSYTWKSWDFETSGYFDVPSTCRAVGTHCYIFVEDALWGTRVTQAAVDGVANAFDSQTPANAAKGIYQMDVETFGAPPDIDGDPRIVILILDVRDTYTDPGTPYIGGYFGTINEFNVPNSNRAEIYYVDANPVDLTTPSGITKAMSVTAHEFQHMIHFGKDSGEGTFINEGCSCFAQANCGYGIYNQAGYVGETDRSLMNWRLNDDPKIINDYGRAARFMQYIGDQIGVGSFMQIVASPLHDLSGLDAGLAAFGSSRRFADIFPDWLVANILDDRSVNTNYGYLYPDLPKVVGTTYVTPNVPLNSGTLQTLAARYLSYTVGSNLKFTLTTSNPALIVKAVEIGSPSRVLDITPGVEFDEPGFGTTYSVVHIVLMNSSQTTPADYSFQSSGNSVTSVELKYEETEPAGYLPLTAGDSACVWFTGAPGGRLDSIRVALHSVGSLSGGIYRFSGTQQPTPLGTRIQFPVTATRSGASPWAKIDLRSFNIDASSSFAVAFPYLGTASTNPRVMVSDAAYASGDVFHSYTYYTEATTDGWYILTDSQSPGNAFAYAIRAYVSFGATDVQEPVNGLPVTTRLEQNYPNPFNPVTIIHYTIGGAGGQGSGARETGAGDWGLGARRTRLVVYDLLGREVATLVDEEKPAGEYEAHFDGSGLPSGVYYYRLTAGAFTQTRPMILVK